MRSAQAVLQAGRVAGALAKLVMTHTAPPEGTSPGKRRHAQASRTVATANPHVPRALGLTTAVLTRLRQHIVMFGLLPPSLAAVSAAKAHAEHAGQFAVRAGACPIARSAASSPHSDSFSSTELNGEELDTPELRCSITLRRR